MKKTGINYAQEEIRKALVQEYLRKHPGVREQDVVLACKEGKLVFTQISEVLADVELRKQSGTILLQANRMFAELAVHHDERWQECVQSTHFCKQMVDCLHSTNFNYFNDMQRYQKLNVIQRMEGICAAKTVQLHEASRKLAALDETERRINPRKVRPLVIDYLLLMIEQLKTLLSVFNQEIKLSDLFLRKANQQYATQHEEEIYSVGAFSIDETRSQWENINTGTGKKKFDVNDSYYLNETILLETKNALLATVETIRHRLAERRKRVQQIWTSISEMQVTVSDMENENPYLQPEPTLFPKPADLPKTKRMARFKDSGKPPSSKTRPE